jgi:hypothetical protein
VRRGYAAGIKWSNEEVRSNHVGRNLKEGGDALDDLSIDGLSALVFRKIQCQNLCRLTVGR